MSKSLPLSFYVGDDGKLTEDSRKTCANKIASFAGKKIHITIEESVEFSSESQREYYFAVIVPAFAQHFASKGQIFDKDQMHDSMMRGVGGFSNPYVNPFTGEPDGGRKSYTRLTKTQAEGYHTLCRKWAAENGFDVPEPNE
jgi:hypothetical protein